MKNEAMFYNKDNFNPFTEEVKARCLRDGKCLVRLRDKQWREVIYKKDPDEPDSSGFRTEDWDFWWYNDGSSPTGDDFDMVEVKD